jgi:Phosphoglycerate dehydrogenase and related dehydrogenases
MSATRRKAVILVTGADLAPQAQAMLEDFELVYAGRTPAEGDLLRLCKEHDPTAIIVRYGRITAPVIEACGSLRVISKHGSGIDNIDAPAAASRGVAVKAAVGANAAAVAEHAWALILSCAKSIPELDDRMHSGHWDKVSHKSLELRGLTLGIAGLGAIGRRVAAIGVAMEMKVVAYDPNVGTAPDGVHLDSLDAVLGAHVVSLHCPLTADNRQMINRDTLKRFREGSILVNTARGGLVDEAALIDALRSGRLRAAALDSFSSEPPPPDHRLRGIPRLIMTPHVAGVSDAAYVNMGVAAARNVLDTLDALVGGASFSKREAL